MNRDEAFLAMKVDKKKVRHTTMLPTQYFQYDHTNDIIIDNYLYDHTRNYHKLPRYSDNGFEIFEENYVIHTRDKIIKSFLGILKDLTTNRHIARESDVDMMIIYYSLIVAALKIEAKHPMLIARANKRIYHHFMYNPPMITSDYFRFLYSQFHPVRFAIETLDSIEDIREEWRDSIITIQHKAFKKSKR